MKELLRGLLCLGALAPMAPAQNSLPTPPDLEALIQDWRAANGDSWHVENSDKTGFAELLYGGSVSPMFVPRDDSQWIGLARTFVDQAQALTGIPGGELRDDGVTFLPLGLAGGTDKMAVAFMQELGGVPVVRGHVDVLLDTSGRLLSIHSQALPGLEGLATQPSLSADSASQTAIAAFSLSFGAPTNVEAAELVITRAEVGELVEARLAWQVEIARENPGAQPAGEILFVDAQNGQILERQSTVHNFDVSGQVVSMATPGTHPDEASNPEVQIPMPFIRLTSSAGTIFADANGNFNYPGVNTALSITVEYRGTYNNVNTQAGSDYTLTTSVPANSPTTIVMNPATPALVTAEANAYLHINTVGEFIRNTSPGDTHADFVATTNPNLAQTCNAYFDGGSTNYYQAGGGCVNTAYSSVIAHEYGHWLNVLYGTGNGGDGMGEGNGDVWGMYVFDDPVVGFNFCGNGCNVRNGNNTRQYCGDGNGGCYGEVHADGEVWCGAAWKVRRNLKTSLGNVAGRAAADSLFMGWMNGYNQGQIDSVIELQWLTLDDNDANINNGTPNYAAINSAFLEQGFPGFVLPAVIFSNVTTLTDTTNSGPFDVDATVVANFAAGISGVDMHWRDEGGSFASVPMTPMGGDLYSAQIPALTSPNLVEYYLVGTDTQANSNSFPATAPAEVIRFGVGTPVQVFFYDFEPAADDEGWTVGAPGDNATTGIWERGDPRGTGAQPENDVTNPGTRCWFTGQGPIGGGLGDNDVDNGTTTLVSPVFDATGLAGVTIGYWRWYSNNTGGAPNADVFVVEVSSNGGSTWSNVETVGPGGAETSGNWYFHEFVLSDVATLTANMRLRFKASDLGTGSVVEAAIDEVGGRGFEPSCPNPTNYCVTSPNSAGAGATISFSGSASVSSNNLTLFATGLPAGQNGLFYYGDSQSQLAFGNGFRCVSGTTHRLPIVNSSLFGDVFYSLDLTALSGPAQIGVGDTVNFQFWYRDPAGGGSAFNLTDGMSATFCP